jgi:hypothetical protein
MKTQYIGFIDYVVKTIEAIVASKGLIGKMIVEYKKGIISYEIPPKEIAKAISLNEYLCIKRELLNSFITIHTTDNFAKTLVCG